MNLLRRCPQCGRRFRIILVEKKVVKIVDKETVPTPPRRPKGALLTIVWPVEEGEPVTIDTQEIQYSYKCKHCGHEWSERRTERHVEKPATQH
jgi:DNA-directed RNA polymerase subunit RPC12/RpoP